MHRTCAIIFALSAMILTGAGLLDSFKSGRWTVTTKTTKFSVPGVLASDPSDGQVSTRTECIDGAGIDPRHYFTASPPGDKCPALTGDVANGRFTVSGQCRRQRMGNTQMSVAGTYSNTSYNGKVTAKFAYGKQTATVEQSIQGKYAGPCKGDEDARK
jgi:Protein of unknown function (DUF3617)